MPTTIPEPTISRLRRAFMSAVRGRVDAYADHREGAVLDHFAGTGAMMWSRLARRDTDMWRSVYIDSAEGRGLTALLYDRYSFERIPDAYGVGEAVLERPTAAAGAGTIWAGTRIRLVGPRVVSVAYVVTQDVPVPATATNVRVPIRAPAPGPGYATTNVDARVDDPLWDASWLVRTVGCGEGTAFEPAAVSRARYRDARNDARVGFRKAIENACITAGASYAVAFQSDYAGDAYDLGLNVVYVGDTSYNGNAALVRRVKIALESARVLGDDVQVLPMVRTPITLHARVYLWEGPGRVNQASLSRVLRGVAVDYFEGRTRGYSYVRESIVGAWLKAAPQVQSAEIDVPGVDSSVVVAANGFVSFPATLPRFVLTQNDVTFELLTAQ